MRSILLITAYLATGASLEAVAAPKPEGYTAHVEANTVTICPMLSERGCPQPEGMLRQNVSKNETVRLPQECVPFKTPPNATPAPPFRRPCYVDRCVPAGTYRYGYARPLSCSRSGRAYYFAEVKVTSSLDAKDVGCGPRPTIAPRVPWKKAPVVCSRGCCRIGNTPSASDGLVFVLLALLWWRQRTSRKNQRIDRKEEMS